VGSKVAKACRLLNHLVALAVAAVKLGVESGGVNGPFEKDAQFRDSFVWPL